MAFVVPIALAVGGGSAAAGAVALGAAALTIGTGVVSARNNRVAGQQADLEAQQAATVEGDAARQREILRKRDLLRAVSSQQAAYAAAGVKSNEGSPESLINLDVARAQEDSNIDFGNTKSRQRALQFRGQNARAAGNAAAATSLLDSTVNTAKIFL